jgi:hypothetical protein
VVEQVRQMVQGDQPVAVQQDGPEDLKRFGQE